jgi:Fic family protein
MNAQLWLWQAANWPALRYDAAVVLSALSQARLAQGRLRGKGEALGEPGQLPAEQQVWTEEALATSAIEGEKLDAAAVRSSIARRLGLAAPTVGASRSTEGLLDVMQDAAQRWNEPLTQERLCSWQAALFPTGQSGLHKIATGAFRSGPDPMQIVSGPFGREVVHFEAVPGAAVGAEMRGLLQWFNERPPSENHDGLVRAALAHLWFETVHPFEDGNGRVGRALVDLALAQDSKSAWRIHGLSIRLSKEREAYYNALNIAQRGDVDVTGWVVWFLGAFERACDDGLTVVEECLERGQFWVRLHNVTLSERQRKALNTMLQAGRGGFEGGMNLRKYMGITQAARATAQRELSHLVEHGVLVALGQGRATHYELPMENWRHPRAS